MLQDLKSARHLSVLIGSFLVSFCNQSASGHLKVFFVKFVVYYLTNVGHVLRSFRNGRGAPNLRNIVFCENRQQLQAHVTPWALTSEDRKMAVDNKLQKSTISTEIQYFGLRIGSKQFVSKLLVKNGTGNPKIREMKSVAVHS